MNINDIKLTQYSHGAGCGCKISPKVLDTILKSELVFPHNDKLLVGNHTRDDAAVYDIGNGQAIISTTDFFMPIVDDAFDFGRIASANAISDVYAMGGKPLLAIAILGWPVDKLAPEVAQRVLEGSRSVCAEAGIALAGGHSIDSPEPIFGLAVTGMVAINQLKQNSTAQEGSLLFLTKPLGIGMLTTAEKKNLLDEEDKDLAKEQMLKLNSLGAELSKLAGVTAMTDVTGFGLLGHLTEMCEGSGLSAEVEYEKVPVIPGVKKYIARKAIPGGTHRNWDSYGHKVKLSQEEQRFILADPQTSGGLLIAVAPEALEQFYQVTTAAGFDLQPFGRLTAPKEAFVTVI